MIAGSLKKILIIGAGKMGHLHLQAFRHSGLAEICGIVSRTEESAQRFSIENKVNYYGTNTHKAIEHLNPNGIVLAASHLENHTILNSILKYKIPVLIEKPVGVNLAEIEKTLEITHSNQASIMVGVNRRFYSTVTQALFSLEFAGGVSGMHAVFPDPKLPFASSQTYPKEVYDNWMMMNTIHGIDLLRLFGGDVKKLSCIGNKSTNISCLLEFEKGYTATLGLNENYGGMQQWKFIAEGNGITATFNTLENLTINFDSGTTYQYKELTSKTAATRPGLLAQAKAFVSLIETGFLVFPSSDILDHYKTLKLINTIQQHSNLN